MRPPYADVTEGQQHFLCTRRADPETPLGPSHKTPANASLTPDPEALNAPHCTVAYALEETPCNIEGPSATGAAAPAPENGGRLQSPQADPEGLESKVPVLPTSRSSDGQT